MNRLDSIREFNEREYKENFFIEPQNRMDLLWDRIEDVIKIYEPRVVVKAGLGSGEIVKKLVSTYDDIILVVVESSFSIVKDFIEKNKDDKSIKNIRYIIGEFNKFPVDYYAADLVISIDNMDILESAPVIDEFKRSLQFEAHLFISGVVLDDEDKDGIYDEYIKCLLPIHNDYYLHEDLKTFMSLKEFAFIKGKADLIDIKLDEQVNYLSQNYKIDEAGAMKIRENNPEIFNDIYKLQDETIKIPYFTGLFMRKKIKTNVQV